MINMNRRTFVKGLGLAAASQLLGCRLFDFGPSNVRFGIVTDLHYANIPVSNWGEGQHHAEALARLAKALEVFGSHNVDFVVELGDFKDLQTGPDGKPDKEATVARAREIESAFAAFKGSRYHVLGNHDLDILERDELASLWPNAAQSRHGWHYSFVRGGIRFVVLDPNHTPDGKPFSKSIQWKWQECALPKEQLDWLAKELADSEEPVIVFSHERLDADPSVPHALRNAPAVREMLERSKKVLAVFQGHDHSGALSTVNGIPYYTLRAMCSGANANSFAEVTIFPDGRILVAGYGKARSAELAAKFATEESADDPYDSFMETSVEMPVIHSQHLAR